jgi:hypothetical protein
MYVLPGAKVSALPVVRRKVSDEREGEEGRGRTWLVGDVDDGDDVGVVE